MVCNECIENEKHGSSEDVATVSEIDFFTFCQLLSPINKEDILSIGLPIFFAIKGNVIFELNTTTTG